MMDAREEPVSEARATRTHARAALDLAPIHHLSVGLLDSSLKQPEASNYGGIYRQT